MDEKLHLRDWMVAQVESGLFEGLLWEDEGKTMFRIPWKHAAKKEYKESEDAALFKAWAVYKGKHREGRDQANPSMWKTRLRCALNKSLDFREVPERNQLDITEPYKVYRILWEDDSRNVHDVCEPRSVGTKKQDALSPISLNSSDLLREHLYCNSRGSNSQSPPLTLTSAVSDFRMQVTLLYRGVSVAQVTTSSPDGCFILQGCPVVGNEEIYGRCTAQQISFPLPDHHPMTPDTRDAMGLLLGHLRKGVLVWVAPEGVFIKRFCQVRVYWSGPAAKHADTPNKLDRGKTFKLLDTPTFITELQNFSRGNGPPPSFEIDLCFGEEYPDPKMARNRKLIMARVVPMFAEDLLRRINLGDSRNERRRSSTHME